MALRNRKGRLVLAQLAEQAAYEMEYMWNLVRLGAQRALSDGHSQLPV